MRFLEKENLNNILIGIVIFLQVITISLVVLCSDCYGTKGDDNKDDNTVAMVDKKSSVIKEDNIVKMVKVDIKGAVSTPGVYELVEGSRVIDVINMAGGLKSSASTKYLNMSKKVSDEMIINIFTSTQIKNMEIKSEPKEECICPIVDCSTCAGANIIENNVSNKAEENNIINDDVINAENKDNVSSKVSLNKGSLEELMTLSGIGESKANAIIEYRNKNNGFKTLEELMNVSGIGEAAYNKIKDFIEL